MIFEDAHWTDPTTLEPLVAPWTEYQPFAMLLIVTFRPEFDPPC